jgi:hypothetical protein
MRAVVIATLIVFTGILGVCWVVAERAHPVMLDIDPATGRHH